MILGGVQRLLEAALILCSLLALFLLFSVWSFSPEDPGWSQVGFANEANNMTGPLGAYVADMLLFCVGRIAFVVPLLVAFAGWRLFRHAYRLVEIDYLTASLRISGGLLLLIGVCGLATLNGADYYFYSAGGILGQFLVTRLLPLLSDIGTTMVLLAATLCGFTLAIGISWLALAERIGDALTSGFERFIWQPLMERRQAASDLAPIAAVAVSAPLAPPPVSRSAARVVREPTFRIEDLAPFEPDQLLADEDSELQSATLPTMSAVEPAPVAAVNKPRIRTPAVVSRGEGSAAVALDGDEPVFALAPAQEPQTSSQGLLDVDSDDLDLPPFPVDDEDDDEELEASSVAPAKPVRPQITAMPALALLDRAQSSGRQIPPELLEQVSRLVEAKLADFGIDARVVHVFPGPVITRFELDLAPGVKVARISNLAKDLARSLSAVSVRVVEVIPGKSYVGLEIPNETRETVSLIEVLESEAFKGSRHPLTMALGKDISGQPTVVNLAKMPHLLVAGTTGSGKSVGVNAMIISMLFKSPPDDVRFIMIDPKMLELSVYEGIPHLLAPVVTDMKDAANALRWCVGEMERRYKLMSMTGVRNLKGFNDKVEAAARAGTPLRDPTWKPSDSMDSQPPLLEPLPSIVVIVDEFADLIMIVGKKVEELIARIAQKARAAGIHLILATQRPSVDVITGLIKANIPTRIAFQVSSKIDSRTILDQQGAEALLGQGDMLYLPPGTGIPTRVHGAFVSDDEVHRVVEDWRSRGAPNYIDAVLAGDPAEEAGAPGERDADGDYDPLYDEAVAFVTESRKASVSSVQRKFKIGYNRAARLVEQMEADGVVTSPGHNGNREVLAPPPPRG